MRGLEEVLYGGGHPVDLERAEQVRLAVRAGVWGARPSAGRRRLARERGQGGAIPTYRHTWDVAHGWGCDVEQQILRSGWHDGGGRSFVTSGAAHQPLLRMGRIASPLLSRGAVVSGVSGVVF